jgi:hypothetical protein
VHGELIQERRSDVVIAVLYDGSHKPNALSERSTPALKDKVVVGYCRPGGKFFKLGNTAKHTI